MSSIARLNGCNLAGVHTCIVMSKYGIMLLVKSGDDYLLNAKMDDNAQQNSVTIKAVG